MPDVAIEPISFPDAFVVSMWRDTLQKGSELLGHAMGFELPQEPNRFTEKGGRIAACISPGRFLVLSEGEGLEKELTELIEPEIMTLVQLGHSRESFRLSGKQSSRLLMKGVAIDLDQAAFPVGALFQSSIHDIGLTALRRGPEQFDLLVYKSFAEAFSTWLADAAMEFS